MATPTTELRYDTEAWAATTELGRRVFNYNYRMTGSEIRGWELVNTADMEHEPGLIERIYIWERKGSDGNALIRVGITETNEWRRAQAQLQTQLVHSMRPDIPRGKGRLAKIGDVSFVGQPPDADTVATLVFTRGNVTVSVASVGKELVDVTSVARSIDRNFSEPPVKKELEAKRALDRSPGPVTVKKLERVQLIERLPEPVTRSGWLKVIVPDGEIAREGDELVYMPPKAGSKRVLQYVVIQE